jgi:acyl carrier protein
MIRPIITSVRRVWHSAPAPDSAARIDHKLHGGFIATLAFDITLCQGDHCAKGLIYLLNKNNITEFLVGQLGVDAGGISDDTPLFSSGLVDSFSLVRLMVFLETEGQFRISPTDVSLDNMDSISRILRFVAQETG